MGSGRQEAGSTVLRQGRYDSVCVRARSNLRPMPLQRIGISSEMSHPTIRARIKAWMVIHGTVRLSTSGPVA